MRRFLAASALFFCALSAWETFLLVQTGEQHRDAPVGLVCFNGVGNPTHGNDWQECRRVLMIPTSR